MIRLADSGHGMAAELRERAEALRAASGGDARSWVGAWARARRTWEAATGESMLDIITGGSHG
jgi:hypothetical protein